MRLLIGVGLAAAALVAMPVAASVDWPWVPGAESEWKCELEYIPPVADVSSSAAVPEIPDEIGVIGPNMVTVRREELTLTCERWVYTWESVYDSLSMYSPEEPRSRVDVFIDAIRAMNEAAD